MSIIPLKIKPLNDSILLTADKIDKQDMTVKRGSVIIDPNKSSNVHSLLQRVIAKGPMVRDIEVGDLVKINNLDYIVIEHPEDRDSIREIVKIRNDYTKYKFPTIMVDDTECLMLKARDIEYVIEDYKNGD